MADDSKAALLSAITTEHFVLQTSIGATLNEQQSRASMFLGLVSGALVAMGFATQSTAIFLPFIATVLPAIFILGLFTVLRLVDISVESSQAYVRLAHIRSYYRQLSPDAEVMFDSSLGRWPENQENPALRFGSFVAYWTSAAAMIAGVNALIGAAAITLLLHLGAGWNLVLAMACGAAFAALCLVGFHFVQRTRIMETDKYSKFVDSLGTG